MKTILIFILFLGIKTSKAQSDWTLQFPKHARNNLSKIFRLKNQFVAWGRPGPLILSPDGLDWSKEVYSLDTNINDMTIFGDSILVAVGNGSIVRSNNGVKWTKSQIDMDAAEKVEFTSIHYTGGLLIALGNKGAMQVSKDGITWKYVNVGSADYYSAVWFGASYLVIGEHGILLTSVDGLLWTFEKTRHDYTITSVLKTEGGLLGVTNGNLIYSSDMGLNWSDECSYCVGMEISNIKLIDDLLIGLGGVGELVTSNYWKSWIKKKTAINVKMNDIIKIDSQYYAVGDWGAILGSTDLSEWKVLNSVEISALNSIGYGADKYVVVGERGVIYYSQDGFQWTKSASGTLENLNSIAWNGLLFIAVGANGEVISSKDGISWVRQTSGVIHGLSSIVWGKDEFIAVGKNLQIIESTDGIQWVDRGSVPRNDYLSNVIWNGSLYIAVGGECCGTSTSNIILSSIDGEEWINSNRGVHSEDFDDPLFSVAWSGELFLAVGRFTKTKVSSDGLIWKPIGDEIETVKRSIIWTGKRFLTVGYGWNSSDVQGIIHASVDGSNWKEVWRPRESLNYVFIKDDLLIAVGDNGGIYTSHKDSVTHIMNNKLKTRVIGSKLMISLPEEFKFDKVDVKLYDMSGKTIKSESLDQIDRSLFLKELKSGQYVVEVNTQRKVFRQLIILLL